MQRWQWAGIAAVLGIALAAGAWFGGRPPPPPPVEVAGIAPPPRGAGLTVHVSGAVAVPGLVDVPPGSRVADVLAAAGGADTTADLSQLNLAAPVRDGDQITVPERHAGGHAPAGGDPRVRVNTASADELGTLPGVGSVTAARIIAHRDEHGPFSVVEDLLDVPGIGEGKLAALRDAVIVP